MNRRSLFSALASLLLAQAVPKMHAEQEAKRGPIIVAAGRRVDAPDAAVARFPPQNVPQVREKIRLVLEKQMPVGVVSAAACGADLLFLDVAAGMRVPRYILLPSEPEVFRFSSVTDRPGNWGDLYTAALNTSKIEVLKLPEGQEGYLETNLRLLDRAQALAGEKHTYVEALVVWNEESRGPDDVTAHFLGQAKRRKIPVLEISTL